jgi:DnaK suppressor protein
MKRHETLDSRTLGALERMLTAKRTALQEESLRRVVTLRTVGAGRVPDEAAWAGESLQGEMEAALVEHRNQQVAQIDAALDRLARQEYGLCQDCEAFIGLERLRALPFARRCTPCQARVERRPAPPARRIVRAAVAAADEED